MAAKEEGIASRSERDSLVRAMARATKSEPEDRPIVFQGDDVPKFLERLRRFQDNSSRAVIVVK